MKMKDKNYRVLLHQRPGDPDLFDWSHMAAYGFLGTRLDQAKATAMLREADAKGKAADTIVYPMGNTALVEVFPA